MAYTMNATDQVFDFIIAKINSKEWNPSSKIWTETKLSTELNVSRMAVRAAVEKLSALSVLKKVQGSGTYVDSMDLSDLLGKLIPFLNVSFEDIIGVMRFRQYFEYGNVCLFIKNCADEDIAALEENYNQMKAYVHDLETFYMLDYDFHHIIAKGTKNALIMKISDIFVDFLKSNHKLICQYVGTEIAIRDHKNIVEYIKLRDEKLAALLMERHIQACLSAMENFINKTKASSSQIRN